MSLRARDPSSSLANHRQTPGLLRCVVGIAGERSIVTEIMSGRERDRHCGREQEEDITMFRFLCF
jgi:hypothetical protein